jgi:hypothetical protein
LFQLEVPQRSEMAENVKLADATGGAHLKTGGEQVTYAMRR